MRFEAPVYEVNSDDEFDQALFDYLGPVSMGPFGSTGRPLSRPGSNAGSSVWLGIPLPDLSTSHADSTTADAAEVPPSEVSNTFHSVNPFMQTR